MAPDDFYVVGGTLHEEAPSYVTRRADNLLHAALTRGEFRYVLTPRQTGKSSLILHTARRLREHGVVGVTLDLAALGRDLDDEQWYAELLAGVGRALDIERELDEFWDGAAHLAPLRRWMEALRRVVMPHVDAPTVLFLDNIHIVCSLPFPTGDFFAAIREWHVRRTEDPDLEPFTFCLLGVATPSQLVDDPLTTPFSIGVRVALRDLDASDMTHLAKGLPVEPATAEIVVDRILHWTGGCPYLTQRLCQLAARAGCETTLGVDEVVKETFFLPDACDRERDLQAVRAAMLDADVDTEALLKLYRHVLLRKNIHYDETDPLIRVLRLSGVVGLGFQNMRVRNAIYERVFDAAWVRDNMPRPNGARRRRPIPSRRGASD